jgi:TolA-binding protein
MRRIAIAGIAVAVAAAACGTDNGGGDMEAASAVTPSNRAVLAGHADTYTFQLASVGGEQRRLRIVEEAQEDYERRLEDWFAYHERIDRWSAEVERQEEERRQREAEERRQREAEERRQREAAQESDVAASAPAAPQPEPTSQPQPDPAPPAPSGSVWDQLAQCESGGNWHINTGNGYYGGLQFALSTWHSVGGTGYPHEHSREEQIRRAEILQQRAGWGQWPACAAKLGLL